MTIKTMQSIIDSLDTLLDQERAALLKGDLDALTHLVTEKERLFDILNASDPGRAVSLSEVQGKVLRNQALLDSALQGIRAVASRLGTMRKIRKTLETYDKTGRKTTIEGFCVGHVEKRA